MVLELQDFEVQRESFIYRRYYQLLLLIKKEVDPLDKVFHLKHVHPPNKHGLPSKKVQIFGWKKKLATIHGAGFGARDSSGWTKKWGDGFPTGKKQRPRWFCVAGDLFSDGRCFGPNEFDTRNIHPSSHSHGLMKHGCISNRIVTFQTVRHFLLPWLWEKEYVWATFSAAVSWGCEICRVVTWDLSFVYQDDTCNL